MALTTTNESCIIREWAPLTDLLNKIPPKEKIGFFWLDVQLTCLDILPEFIALGTNLGIVYWYDRKSRDIKTLESEDKNYITTVKIVSTVDYMVACGNKNGNINIFQIPKSHPETIPESLRPKNKKIERYSVTDLHKSTVTALEWSKNGMKLFSGDKKGFIVSTEIDFYMHISKSSIILNESFEIVQLSYNQQSLLISTTYRSIICKKINKWEVSQIGRKDRKMLGPYGGIICRTGLKPSETFLYCTRPGVRIWVADVEGSVQKTILFKDILCKECPEVPIINPISKSLKALKPQQEPSFGVVLSFNNNLLVTYNNDVLYIVDPEQMTILATVSQLRRILWVATYKDEIFILEGERSIIRISYKPETGYGINQFITNSNPLSPITSSIKDFTSKIQTTNIISAIPPFIENTYGANDVNIHTDNTMIMNAEEAKESPIKTYNNIDKFSEISKQEFNEKILYKKTKMSKRKSPNKLPTIISNPLNGRMMTKSTTSLSSNSSEETYSKHRPKQKQQHPTLMTLSSIGILPDLRSPESIQNDIEYKEKLLAEMLNLNKIKILSDNFENCNNDNKKEEEKSIMIEENTRKYDSVIPIDYESPPVPFSNTSKSKPKSSSTSTTVPACLNIPNEWKLSDIQLNTRTDTSLSDNSLNDWELV